MPLVNVTLPSDNTTADVKDYNDPIIAILTTLNGGLDDDNIDNVSGTKLNAGTTPGSALQSDTVTEDKMEQKISELIADFVVSGGIVAQVSGLEGSFSNIDYYIGGSRYAFTGIANKTYTASRDTYVDIGTDGTVDYTEVTNGAASPALSADHIRLAKVVTDGSAITSVVQTGIDSNGIAIYQVESKEYVKYFTTVGTNTWTKPAGLRYVIVEVQGGGGAGGGTPATNASQWSAGNGGGGGAYARKKILSTELSATETVTVGVAGASISGSTGGSGGTSSFGSHCTADGGGGGTTLGVAANITGGYGGGGSPATIGTGDVVFAGQYGEGLIGDPTGNTNISRGGAGGASYFSGGGRNSVANSSGVNVTANSYGSGGGGSAVSNNQSATAGGAGAAGIVIIHEYF